MSKAPDANEKVKVASLFRAITTTIRRAASTSDVRRWGNRENLLAGWDTRTKQIADLIKPGSSVLEFGAGRLVLKSLLPESCAYTPSDLVDRGHGTIVADLNAAALPAFGSHDVAVFSGVLEYVNDVPQVIGHLAGSVNSIVASYAVLESNRNKRRAKGWVNDYTAAQFVAIFEKAGFSCTHVEPWKRQQVYKFEKQP